MHRRRADDPSDEGGGMSGAHRSSFILTN
jgi:hypothetical protein